MERFITRKRKENADEPTVASSDNVTNFNQSAKKQKTTRRYCESYLEFGFTWCGNELQPSPNCLVCDEKLANQSILPNKLKRHLAQNHPHLTRMSKDYSQTLLYEKEKQATMFKQFCRSSISTKY